MSESIWGACRGYTQAPELSGAEREAAESGMLRGTRSGEAGSPCCTAPELRRVVERHSFCSGASALARGAGSVPEQDWENLAGVS